MRQTLSSYGARKYPLTPGAVARLVLKRFATIVGSKKHALAPRVFPNQALWDWEGQAGSLSYIHTRPSAGASCKLALLCLAIFLALSPLTACLRGGKPGLLVIAIEQPPRGFDPRLSSGNSYSARIMQLIYDTLMIKDQHFDFVPSLADSFQESPDHTTFTFHLRTGVKFHNGKMVGSEDVKYTFESILSPAFKSPIRGSIDKISSIETPDPLTVVFKAREPFYTFAGNLPAIGIVPAGSGAAMADSPVGTGPYRFVSYSEADGVRLEANQEYWGGAPRTPRLLVESIPDNSTRQAALMRGEVDMAYNAQFDPETVRAMASRRDLQVVTEGGTNIAHLGVNLTSSILSNEKVRQAISCAIDRDTIIHRLLRDQARSAVSILPPEQWAYDSALPSYDYDPERARRLLDQAGFPDPDANGPQPRFALTLITSTNQLSRNIAAIMQDQLRRVGIALKLESLETATFFDHLAQAQFDLYYVIGVGGNQSTDIFQFAYHSRYHNDQFNDAIGKLSASDDPVQMKQLFELLAQILDRKDYCLNPEVDKLAVEVAKENNDRAKKRLYLTISGLLTDAGGANRSRYCNPEVDRWIEGSQQAPSRDQQRGYYQMIQERVSEELPQIYLWYPANVLIARKRVGDIQIEPSGSWYFITRLSLENR
jgi:peptide/nickel transport system substrate-binding protein